MASPKPLILRDILEEHVEEFSFLWQQRQKRLRSPEHTLPQLLDLEERIEAHIQGLLVAGDELESLVGSGLDADESLPLFLAAYPLLRLGTLPAGQRVFDAFLKAEGGKLDGLRQAMCYAGQPLLGALKRTITAAPDPVAIAAMEVLACHGKLDIEAADFDLFLRHENAQVRRAAWRTAARTGIPKRAGAYPAGLSDPDSHVQRETLWAAAWQRQLWLLDDCRRLAARPTPENWDSIYLLAILGKAADARLILNVTQTAELGPRRFEAAAACGHPELIEVLLAAMESSEIPTAVAAAKAFTRITGLEVESDRRVQVPLEDGHEPDEFEKEFLDEVKLPDAQRARAYWKKEASRYRQGTRWCRGLNLSQGPPPQGVDVLDLASRWEACLRGGMEGTWKGTMSDLEVFPQ